LHFDKYDRFILPPVIKEEIGDAVPVDKGHVTVYLPAYDAHKLARIFKSIPSRRFHIFTKQVTVVEEIGNSRLLPVDKSTFNKSLIDCNGVITGAGFETPAEALHLGKKLLCIPIRGQYEQFCNAAALMKLGITCHSRAGEGFGDLVDTWLAKANPIRINYKGTISALIERLMEARESMEQEPHTELLSPLTSLLFPS
ncbi:MAG: glycosyl transferase, partial [Chitinophagaceae bacterium]|nr:glycosyl transferase [Chitinophagaceae bacterium]